MASVAWLCAFVAQVALDTRGAMRAWAVHLAVAFALGWWWRSSTHRGDRLVVARDRWRYFRGTGLDEFELPVLGYDADRRELRLAEDGAFVRRAVPGVASDGSDAEPIEWLDGTVARRDRRCDDSLLTLPNFAAIRARVGVGVSATVPFRADGTALSREVASSLLDDRSASRAELVAASLVLVEGGRESERARVFAVADACDDEFFAELLRDVARDGDVEASYTSFRARAGRVGRVFNALLPRVAGLVSVAIGSALVLRAPTMSLLTTLLPGLCAVALLGEARRQAYKRGLFRRGALTPASIFSLPVLRDVVAAAIGLSVFRSHVPSALVPVLLYLTFWGAQLVGAPGRSAPREESAADASDATTAAEDVGEAANVPASTAVRVEVDATRSPAFAEHEASAPAKSDSQRR